MKFLFILFCLFYHSLSFAQITCLTVDCKSTIQVPQDTLSLNGTIISGDKILQTKWALINGPGPVVITNPLALSTPISKLTVGTYIFSFSAITTKTTSSVLDTIIVLPINKVPKAVITPITPSITLPFNTVTLSGLNSVDSDGVVSGYLWSNGQTTSTISPVFGAAGTYNFSLTVTDNQGASNITSTSVTVNPAIILPPIVTINNQPFITGTTDTLIVTATDPNQGGSITKYGWGKIAGVGTQIITGASTSKAIITGLQSGQYQFKVTAWNTAGLSNSATATFTINQSTKTITKIVITYSDGTTQTIP